MSFDGRAEKRGGLPTDEIVKIGGSDGTYLLIPRSSVVRDQEATYRSLLQQVVDEHNGAHAHGVHKVGLDVVSGAQNRAGMTESWAGGKFTVWNPKTHSCMQLTGDATDVAMVFKKTQDVIRAERIRHFVPVRQPAQVA